MNKYKLILVLLFFGSGLFAQLDSTYFENHDFEKKTGLAALEVFSLNLLVNQYDWHFFQGGQWWAQVSPETWEDNLQHGLEWDWNAFSNNWWGHPYHGSLYFNSARSLGHTYWESSAFALGGSIMWEYFGEVHAPSGNDIGTTVLGGMFLGEMFHRVSDKLLSHEAHGLGRFWRVSLATIINPMRAFNRWVAGKPRNSLPKYNRYTTQAPLKMHVALGGNFLVKNLNINDTRNGPYIEFGMIYGDPYEDEDFYKPFDFFTVRSWLRFSNTAEAGAKFLNVYAYGALWGKNIHYTDKAIHMFGAFQHYDYLHNESIEIGTVGATAGLVSKYMMGRNWELLTSLQLGPSILGGATSEIVGDFSNNNPETFREYVLGPGIIAKADAVLEHPKAGSLITRLAHYTVFIYSGPEGSENVNFLDFRYITPHFGPISLGVNYTLYLRNVKYNNFPEYSDFEKNLFEFKTFVAWNF